jgi:hypothetical protein
MLRHWSGRACTSLLTLDYLQGCFDDLSASHLAWLITTLLPAGLPADYVLVTQALSKLADLQQPDGRWQSDDGPDFDVSTTLEALFALSFT